MISVVIPVYKKTEEFIKNFKNNFTFFSNQEIIIINDDPEKSIKKYLKNQNIVLIENKKNLGFGKSVNKGITRAKSRFILLLNSDVILRDKNYINALKYFSKNKNLFAVGFAQKEKNNDFVGKNKIYWKKGFLLHKNNPDMVFGANAWAEGGACIIDRNKFLQLNGFDPLYTPFYWEDIDLSYRAWKSGYEILFDPGIFVVHQHESTISSFFSKKFIKTIAYRNQFIFIWKNISDLNLKLSHFLWLIPNIIFFLIKMDFAFVNGFLLAINKIGLLLNTRKKQKKSYHLTDYDILNKFK